MKLDKCTFDKKYDVVDIVYSDNTKASVAFYLDKDSTMHWYEYKGVCVEKVIREVLEHKFKFKTLSRHESSNSFRNAQRISKKSDQNKAG